MKSGGRYNAAKDAINNIFRNTVMSTASIVILLSCLLIIGSSVLISFNLDIFATKLEQTSEVTAFIDDKFINTPVDELTDKIKGIDNVFNVTYQSKEEAIEKYITEINSSNEQINEQLRRDNPLRASFFISFKDLSKYDETLNEIKKIDFVAKIKENRNNVQSILQIKSAITIISIWAVVIFLFLSLFIISNTVRLAMFTRKLEINIMKYVGATDWFIRKPFLFEGFFIGIIAGSIAFALQALIYIKAIVPLLADMNIFVPLRFGSYYGIILGAFLVTGAFIGVAGSILPMKKYLHA